MFFARFHEYVYVKGFDLRMFDVASGKEEPLTFGAREADERKDDWVYRRN